MSKILVAGGGLAGAAAAAGLALGGADVTLIERQAAPKHKICGEFLSSEAQVYLARIGLELDGFQAAPISRLRLVRGERVIETTLPFRGIGLSRRRLDEALLRHAERCGARVLRGRTVRRLDGERLALEVEGEGVMSPERLLLATGKHDLRGAGRAAGSDLLGLKMHFRLTPPARAALAQHIELIFFPGGYAGLQMIEDGIANLCLLVRREHFRQCGSEWGALLRHLQAGSPHLEGRLRDAAPEWQQPLAVYRLPYGYLHAPLPGDHDRLYRLGDQACVIQPFTGDGMAIALHSAALAVRMVQMEIGAGLYHRRLAGDVRGQMRRAAMLDRLLNHAAQPAVFALARAWPGAMRAAAAATRVPLRARL